MCDMDTKRERISERMSSFTFQSGQAHALGTWNPPFIEIPFLSLFSLLRVCHMCGEAWQAVV